MDGWSKGSAEAFVAPFADDGDLIGFDGTHLKGRREIVSFHQPLFDKWLKGTRLVGEVVGQHAIARVAKHRNLRLLGLARKCGTKGVKNLTSHFCYGRCVPGVRCA